MIIIITSSGYGAGKTEVSKAIHNYFRDSREIHIATPIKQIAFKMGWNGMKDNKGRKLLQEIGDLGKTYDKKCWLKLWADEADQIGGDLIIVDDVRYMEEYAYIRKHTKDFFHIHITHRGIPSEHKSEQTDWSEVFPFPLPNTGSVIELRETAIEIVKNFIEETRRNYAIKD